jgi:hypothetical protein
MPRLRILNLATVYLSNLAASTVWPIEMYNAAVSTDSLRPVLLVRSGVDRKSLPFSFPYNPRHSPRVADGYCGEIRSNDGITWDVREGGKTKNTY